MIKILLMSADGFIDSRLIEELVKLNYPIKE